MAQRKFAPIQTPKERMIADRVRRAQAVKSPVDRTSNFHEQLGELSRDAGVPIDELIEEWSSRAAAREYEAGFTRDAAEEKAMADVRERYEARIKG